jgi:TrmH family RNA methyltransferase
MPKPELDRLRPIASRQNALVKELRAAFQRGRRTEEGYCAVDGVRLLEEAIRSRVRFRAVFFSQSARDRAPRLLAQIGHDVETLLLPDDVFHSAVSTETPQGVAALVKWKERKLDEVLAATEPLLLYAAGIQDPGNLGTMIRSAEAFGARVLMLGPGTVSPFNPKVIRASAGSLFRLPVFHVEQSGAALEKMREKGVRFLATSSHKGKPVAEADLKGPLCFFLGREGTGLPRELLKEMDETLAIPHSPRVESLNAGVAASILLYEASRQRAKQ